MRFLPEITVTKKHRMIENSILLSLHCAPSALTVDLEERRKLFLEDEQDHKYCTRRDMIAISSHAIQETSFCRLDVYESAKA